MMNGLKGFIKQRFVNESHPLLWSLWFERMERRTLAEHERHKRMSYAEIEAEIGERYEQVFGRKLNWDNPQTYNEKINVSKVYMATPLKTMLADKYLVREWIREKIGEEYLIPLLGVYDSFDEIDFDSLPDRFVIKCNHDSGSYTLVNDKRKLNMKIMKQKYDFYLKRNFAWYGFEMHYRDIRPKILIEEYLGDDICDYKFMCFGGKMLYCQAAFDLATSPGAYTRNFYDADWNWIKCYCPPTPMDEREHECPKEWPQMIEIAEKLSEGIDQVRVDLFLIDGKIYFGEMTFTDGNGFASFVPDGYDYKFGECWQFDNSIRKKILAEHSRP